MSRAQRYPPIESEPEKKHPRRWVMFCSRTSRLYLLVCASCWAVSNRPVLVIVVKGTRGASSVVVRTSKRYWPPPSVALVMQLL